MPRTIRWLLFGLAALLLAAVVAVLALQSSESARQRLIERVSGSLESASGWTLEVDSSRLRVLSGAVELGGVEVLDGRGERVMYAESVRAEVAWRPLLGGRIELRSLEIDRPLVELSRLSPERSGAASDPGGAGLTIERLRLSGGRLSGVPLGEGLRGRLTAISIDDVSLEGSLTGDALEAELTRATLRAARPEAEPLTLELTGAVQGPLAGPLQVVRSNATGSGLSLAAEGVIGLDGTQPLELTLAGEVAAGLLAEALPSPAGAARDAPEISEGSLALDGAIDLRRGSGGLAVEASALPAELLGGFVDLDSLAPLEVAGTTLSVAGNLSFGARAADAPGLGPHSLERLSGDLRLTWTRSGTPLMVLEVRPQPPSEGEALRVPFELSVAPRLPGRREARGTVVLADWRLLDQALLQAGVLEIDAPDLGAQIEALDELWPGALGAATAAIAGGLVARADATGPLLSPSVDLVATWSPAAGAAARFRAVGEPLALSGRVEAELSRVRLSHVGLDDAEAVLDGRLAFESAGSSWSGRFDVKGAEISAGDWHDAAIRAVGTLDPSAIRFSTLRGEWQGHRLEATEAAEGGPPLTLEATGAGLRLEAPRLELDELGGALIVEAPAALLGEVPWLGSRAWPEADPSDRRLRVAWELPPADLAPALGLESSRLVAATEGEVRIDLDAPALSTGSARLTPLEAVAAELTVALGGSLQLRLADGVLEVETSGLGAGGSSGELSARAELDPEWSWGDAPAALATSVDARGESLVDLDGLVDLLGLEPTAGGELEVAFALSGPIDSLSGRFEIDGPQASWSRTGATPIVLSAPALELELEQGAWRVVRLEARVNEEPLEGTGSGRLAEGRLEVEELRLELAGLEWLGRASVPLGSSPDDQLRLDWRVPVADWHPALTPLGLLRPGDTLRAGNRGRISFSTSRPAAAEARIEVTGFETVTGGRRAVAEEAMILEVGGGRLELAPLTLVADDQRFRLSASADLDQEWSPEQSYLELLRDVRLEGAGTLLTSILNPFLAGGVAEGFLTVDLAASGSPAEIEGRLSLRGQGASLIYPRPYSTRISEPDLEVTFEAGEVARLEGSLRLNEGRVELEGGMSREGVVDLEARLDGVRYRLDYGLLALLGGELALVRSSTGAMALSGEVTVEEGVLTRDIDVDLELLAQLLAPVDLTGTEESPLDDVALELDLSTIEGVRVKNNVADLLVIWDPIKIRGTLAAPVLDGRFTIEPGGRIRAFGQTVRLDRSSIDFPGQPDQPATLDLSTTSSREDASIAVLSREDPFAREESEVDEASEQLFAAAAGLGAYYGERIASRLTEALGGARISLQPVLIFGEADPGARLTVSQDFSPQFTLAASIDLRNAEAQTYVLDLHGLEGLPGLNAQAFTTDEDSQGAALRQRLQLGPGGKGRSTAPVIRKIRLPRVEGVSKRGLKRAVGLRKGDRLEASDRFAAEVAVGEYLRERGFSDARVDAAVAEVGKGVALEFAIEPGPRAEFVFEGETLPKPLRRLVASLYRSDYYEATALEEMAVEARRGLRSLGYLEPEVRVEVRPREPAAPAGDRIVTVSMAGGRRIELESLLFEPLPEDEAALLAARFSRPVQRVELATGVETADRRVESTLRYLGYEEPRVERRELSGDGSELRVRVDTGARGTIATVDLEGVGTTEAEALLELTALEAGAPLRPDRIARAAVLLREELRRRGYADTRIEPLIGPGAREGDADVLFEVDPGDRFWVGEVRFEGTQATRPRWAERVAGLEVENDFTMDEVLEARSRLWQTGLFSAVIPEVDRAPGGSVRVGFELRERKRFELAYGLRWDSEDEASALIEVIDRNALGRGWITGLRVQYAEDDQSARAFAGLPRLIGPRSALELFALVREETEDGLITETLEGTVQLSYALGRRLTGRLYGQVKDTRVREEVPNDFFPIDVQLSRPLLGTQLLYDRRSGDQLGVRGLLVTADLSASDEAIGSDFSYARFFGQVNSFVRAGRLLDRPLTWAQSVRVGLAEAFDQELVRQDRFFAGGAFSVRGYGTESLGPQEDLVVVVRPLGGEALFVLNEELRWRITESLSGLWFVDAGNVWENRSDFGSDLVTSTGLGLRALTPLGLLRLDLAHALDRREGLDPEFKLYFGFGSTF